MATTCHRLLREGVASASPAWGFSCKAPRMAWTGAISPFPSGRLRLAWASVISPFPSGRRTLPLHPLQCVPSSSRWQWCEQLGPVPLLLRWAQCCFRCPPPTPRRTMTLPCTSSCCRRQASPSCIRPRLSSVAEARAAHCFAARPVAVRIVASSAPDLFLCLWRRSGACDLLQVVQRSGAKHHCCRCLERHRVRRLQPRSLGECKVSILM